MSLLLRIQAVSSTKESSQRLNSSKEVAVSSASGAVANFQGLYELSGPVSDMDVLDPVKSDRSQMICRSSTDVLRRYDDEPSFPWPVWRDTVLSHEAMESIVNISSKKCSRCKAFSSPRHFASERLNEASAQIVLPRQCHCLLVVVRNGRITSGVLASTCRSRVLNREPKGDHGS